ncbi:putative nucleotidyltransferase, ribonuclease H [Tanacetum coccineum]
MSSRSKFGLGFGDTFGSDEVFDLSAPSIFDSSPKDVADKSLYDRFVKVVRMHVVPPPIIGTFMPPSNKPDLEDTQKRHDAIWVVVDRLTKSAHFLPIRKNYGIKTRSLTISFLERITESLGNSLKFSTAFHPQTDGQSERTIQTLEDMLRACALEWTGSWDEYLCLVEFAYNNSWHASIKAAPFELLYGRKCRAPICREEVGRTND